MPSPMKLGSVWNEILLIAKILHKDSFARLRLLDMMFCFGAINLPESNRLGGTCLPA